jgi:hypothetical protein
VVTFTVLVDARVLVIEVVGYTNTAVVGTRVVVARAVLTTYFVVEVGRRAKKV